MKIDTDLRLAIRAAEKSQPSSDYSVRNKQEQSALADFLKRYPEKDRAIKKLLATINRANITSNNAAEQLSKQYGLHRYGGSLELRGGDESRARFIKAGGKLPTLPGQKWKFDTVMTELAAAEPKDAAKILKKYGINWK